MSTPSTAPAPLPSPTVALSTCWCSQRHVDGYDMVREMVGLGFEWIELSHGIRISLVPGILKAVSEGMVRISTVHNFCPLPTGVMSPAPNLYEPSAKDERERNLWLRYTRNTIDFARRIGCDTAVLHSGSVRFFWGSPRRKIERRRADRPREELLGDASFQKLLTRTMDRVRRNQVRYRNWLKESLLRVLPYAQERGVRLALENREGILELPLDDEFADFLAELPASPFLGYWHDYGHAQIKEQLGLASNEGLLRANRSRLIGAHVHDVSPGGVDHLALGSGGTVDLALIPRFLGAEHRLVLELSPRLRPEEVAASRDRVRELYGLAAK